MRSAALADKRNRAARLWRGGGLEAREGPGTRKAPGPMRGAAGLRRTPVVLVHQAVEFACVLAGHLVGDFGRQMRELLVDVLLRFRPHAVGMREVRAPH